MNAQNSSAFNVAPHPRRYRPVDMLVLAACALIFLASLVFWVYESRQNDWLQAQSKAKLVELKRERALQNQASMGSQMPSNAEKVAARKAVQASLELPWDGVMDALEVATASVQSGVSLLSLVPKKAGASEIHLGISAVAIGEDLMLAFIRALKKDTRVRSVALISQQSDDSAPGNPMRFQLTVSFAPPETPNTHASQISKGAQATP